MDQKDKRQSFQYWFGILDALKLDEDEWCVICPFGIGDTYFVCALAEEFLKYNGGGRFSVIVKPGQEDIPLLFDGISRVFVADGIDLDVVRQWTAFRPGNPVIGHPRYYENGALELYVGANGSTLLDLYYHIFRLPSGLPLAKPRVPERYLQSAAAKFKAAGLPEGRTVVLAPYANSSIMLPMVFWQALAEILQAVGWTAVTNVTPGSSEIIPGTIPIGISLGEALPFAGIAGRVISARSGLCDLLSAIEEKLTVIYLHQPWNAGTLLTGCSLRRMGISQTVREFEVSANVSITEVLQAIVSL